MVFIIITRVNHHHSYNTCVYHNNDKCNDHFLKHLVCEVVHGSVVVEQVLRKRIRMDWTFKIWIIDLEAYLIFVTDTTPQTVSV